jgi:N-methylhydantoinase B/oxoprolinase/acetone carboxylase alpha subunit
VALRSKLSELALRRGDTIRIETSGGGGYGAPEARDPAAIAADRALRYVNQPPIGERQGG